MILEDIIEFRKDLYFEGAVQIDWFYSPERAKRVAENFVFHGSEYFGVESAGFSRRIDTISLTKALLEKIGDEKSNPLSLLIADYGTGKSHLAVTLGQLLSGPSYMPGTYEEVLRNIDKIDHKSSKDIRELSSKRNLVLVINGMRDFNLHSELLKSAEKSLSLYGVSDEKLRNINKSIEIAHTFFERNYQTSQAIFERQAVAHGWTETGTSLKNRINSELLTDSTVFEIINAVYEEINGHKIRWDEDISASAILNQLINEYCGIGGVFDSVVLLFDEFGRYLEYASGTDSARSGESALQQIFECAQNSDGLLHVINLIQSDIKSYLQRIDNTKNISRYIGRYDVSDKYYISSNLETVFANLIHRKDQDSFNNLVVSSLNSKETYWKSLFSDLNNWRSLTGIWSDYSLFRKVVVEGIYPLHPLSVFMLTQLSDYLQNRSSLTMISQYIQNSSKADLSNGDFFILPEELLKGDLYTEMLSSEQEGKQTSQHCIRYSNILSKYGDKLSDGALEVLRSNLVLRILRFKTNSLDEVKRALLYCCRLSIDELEKELDILTNEYGILGFDDRANCFDFMEESNGAHDYKIIKKRILASTKFDPSLLTNNNILEIGDILTNIETQFGTIKHISTKEWEFKQELITIEELNNDIIARSILDWGNAIQPELPKGKVIWLYVNKNTDVSFIDEACKKSDRLKNMPIVLMLLNDSDNHLYNDLVEYKALITLDEGTKARYSRHYEDDVKQNLSRISTDFINLKRERAYLTDAGVSHFNDRLAKALTSVFEKCYPKAVSFPFDGFVSSKYNISKNQAKTYVSIIRALLSGEINDSIIHSWPTETRNRFAALFDNQSKNSWKCFSDNSHITPPEEKSVRTIYDSIVDGLEKNGSIKCSDILNTLAQPPYGLNYYAILTVVCLIIANRSYCTRFVYNDETLNTQSWRDRLLIKDDKTSPDVFNNSTLMHVDTDEVAALFNSLFNQIESNKNPDRVDALEQQLKQLTQENELPSDMIGRNSLALKIINDGKNAQSEFNKLFASVSQGKDRVHPHDLYPAVKIINELQDTDFGNAFEKYNYEYTDLYKSRVMNLYVDMKQFVLDNFEEFMTTVRCSEVQRLISFRNHTNRLVEEFSNAGFSEFASQIKERAQEEMDNVEFIQSRATFNDDFQSFYKRCSVTKFTSYSQINQWKKECEELIKRFNLFRTSLKNAAKISSGLIEKRDLIKDSLLAVQNEIGDIFDRSFELTDPSDIDALLVKISDALKRGLDDKDSDSLIELQNDLETLKSDVGSLIAASYSRTAFESEAEKLLNEYEEKDSDLLNEEYLDRFVSSIRAGINKSEYEWIAANLTLRAESDSDIYAWKECIKNLPLYLTEETVEKVRKLDLRAEEVLKQRRVETALHYFNELSSEEKSIFLKSIRQEY